MAINKNGFEVPDGITADVIVIDSYAMKILLIKRKHGPFKDHWALPGGFVNPNETILQAAIREIGEETNLNISGCTIDDVGIYDDPNRDPRGRIISICYSVFINLEIIEKCMKAMDDVCEIGVFDVEEIKQMNIAFDHRKIIGDFLEKNNLI